MKIFYLCRTGHHTSLVAAALHLMNSGRLESQERQIDYNDLLNTRGFDKINFHEIGKPFFVGVDEKKSEVYTIGVWRENVILAKAVNDMARLLDDKGQCYVIDTSPVICMWTKLGLMLKKMHLKRISGIMLKRGVITEIPALMGLISENKKIIYH